MNEEGSVIEQNEILGENWKRKTVLIGAILGVLSGMGAAYLLIQRAERDGTEPKLTFGEGIKLGLLVLGLLRQVAQLGE